MRLAPAPSLPPCLLLWLACSLSWTQAFLGPWPASLSSHYLPTTPVARSPSPSQIGTRVYDVHRQHREAFALYSTLKTRTEAKAKSTTEVVVAEEEHPYKEALTKTAISVTAALLFGLGVISVKGLESGLEYYAG